MIDPKIARLLDRFIEATGFDRWEPHPIEDGTFRSQFGDIEGVLLRRWKDSASGLVVDCESVPAVVFRMSTEWKNPVAVAGMRAALDEYLKDTMSTPETPWGTC